jgi:Holliday junction DNA helicase RuvA
MIRSLHGVLVDIDHQTAIVRPGEGPASAFEIEVLVPAYWSARLHTQAGERVTVFCRVLLESQNQGASFVPRLLGFPSASDRAFFEVFTSVKGLGQRRAMRAMASPPGEIAAWIAARNAKSLQTLPEIGKRLAETVIAELNGKVDGFVATGATIEPLPGPVPADGPAEDAVAALVALGQTRPDAEKRVARVFASDPDAADLTADELVARSFALA